MARYFNIWWLIPQPTVVADQYIYWDPLCTYICGSNGLADRKRQWLKSTSGALVAYLEQGLSFNEEKSQYYVADWAWWSIALPSFDLDPKEWFNYQDRVVSDVPAPHFADRGTKLSWDAAKKHVEEFFQKLGYVLIPGLTKAKELVDANSYNRTLDNLNSLCGRCFAKEHELYSTCCNQQPELIHETLEGRYFCPDCFAVLTTGKVHPKVCFTCLERQHPDFDVINKTA